MPDSLADLNINVASHTLRNRGPWTTVEYLHWPRFQVGHTTALSAGASVDFQQADTMNTFMSLGFPQSTHHAEQIHGSQSVNVDGFSACHRGMDGLMHSSSGDAGPALFLRTADCLPVYIRTIDADASGKSPGLKTENYALVHAGWRGLIARVIPNLLERFAGKTVEIFVGPHITVQEYEVGEEVISAVEDCLGCTRTELRDRGVLTEQNHLDLFQVLGIQLARWGGTIRAVWRSSLATSGTSPVPLISYRKQATEDRLVHWFHPDQEIGTVSHE